MDQTFWIAVGSVAAVLTVLVTAIGVWISNRRRRVRVEQLTPAQHSATQVEIANAAQITNAPQISPQFHMHFNGTQPEFSTSRAPTLQSGHVHSDPGASDTGESKATPRAPKVKTVAEIMEEKVRALTGAMSEVVAFAHDLADQYGRVMHQEDRFSARLEALLLLGKVLHLPKSNARVSCLVAAIRDVSAGIASLELTFEGDDPRDVLLTYLDPFAAYSAERSPTDMVQVFSRQMDRIIEALHSCGFSIQKSKVFRKPYDRYSLTASRQRSDEVSVEPPTEGLTA